MASVPILRISGLEAGLPAAKARVLSDISLTIEPGRILGVIGESGAGKSMLGNAIADTLAPGIEVTNGRINFDGHELTTMSRPKRRQILGREIGFIPQEPMTALNPSLTVGQQFVRHLKRIGIEQKSSRKARAIELLDEVGLHNPSQLLHSYPHQLSGGMLQRVLIAMAFASNPRLVIADEPTTALDVTMQALVMELIKRMRDSHQTSVLLITHDLRLAADVCDDVSVLYAGRIVEDGPAKSILNDPRHPYSRCLNLATPSMEAANRTLLILPKAMASIAERNELRGCEFAPRCPLAVEHCSQQRPPLETKIGGHRSACFRSELTATIETPPGTMDALQDFSSQKIVLKASNLRKSYVLRDLFGRARHVEALKGLNFEVREGEFVGVVGESGSGKTTLTKLIVGLEDVSEGELRVAELDGADHSSANRRRILDQVQLVFQDPESALNPRRTVGSLTTQAVEAKGLPPSAQSRDALARQLLEYVKLTPDMISRFPKQLSGGQKQRVNIARALCSNPRLLVADEIVSGLDVSVQAQILELLRELRKKTPFSLLLISHDLSVVRHLCDRALVMYKGEIVEQGPVDEVFGNPRHDYTRTLVAAAIGKPPHEMDIA
ncbi:ABC transporter ATP-binding protein [Martelella mediterranea]|uniref:ABC transporter ATP-binding protein n=1 Tax=Martelella mediterranea TaxID=293089 RepID=UPI001E3ED49D|nr:ABC transporter ATP-binding protein [Martelella mediterranea]MCD1634377.1 ABC transporter ATP-binding protein [Martelella mediterranea]